MNYRRFGRTGWNVSEIGYGMWAWPAGPAPPTPNRSPPFSAPQISAAISLTPPGPTATDTASSFSERSCAPIKTIRRRRTRQETLRGHKSSAKNRRWPARPVYSLDDSYPPDYIFEYVDKSLKNIGVDTLDLIQLHTWEDRWLEDERVLRAAEKLRSSGKIRAFGLSLNRWEPANGNSRRARRLRRRRPSHLQHL